MAHQHQKVALRWSLDGRRLITPNGRTRGCVGEFGRFIWKVWNHEGVVRDFGAKDTIEEARGAAEERAIQLGLDYEAEGSAPLSASLAASTGVDRGALLDGIKKALDGIEPRPEERSDLSDAVADLRRRANANPAPDAGKGTDAEWAAGLEASLQPRDSGIEGL